MFAGSTTLTLVPNWTSTMPLRRILGLSDDMCRQIVRVEGARRQAARCIGNLALRSAPIGAKIQQMSAVAQLDLPDAKGRFGQYGGRFVPETLMHPLQELESEYFRAQKDPEFQRELEYYLKEFCGRPTPLYYAERLTRELGGAKIYLKRA